MKFTYNLQYSNPKTAISYFKITGGNIEVYYLNDLQTPLIIKNTEDNLADIYNIMIAEARERNEYWQKKGKLELIAYSLLLTGANALYITAMYPQFNINTLNEWKILAILPIVPIDIACLSNLIFNTGYNELRKYESYLKLYDKSENININGVTINDLDNMSLKQVKRLKRNDK